MSRHKLTNSTIINEGYLYISTCISCVSVTTQLHVQLKDLWCLILLLFWPTNKNEPLVHTQIPQLLVIIFIALWARRDSNPGHRDRDRDSQPHKMASNLSSKQSLSCGAWSAYSVIGFTYHCFDLNCYRAKIESLAIHSILLNHPLNL